MRAHRLLRSVSLALLPILLAACGEDPVVAPVLSDTRHAEAPAPVLLDPEVPDEPVIDVEAIPPKPPDPEEVRAKQEEWRRKMDEHGRGLIESFQARVFEPVRDGELRVVEGVAHVRARDVEGSYRIVFDGALPPGKRISVVAEPGAEALPPGSLEQVGKFADLALNGPYRFVVQYYPPIQMLLTYSKDRQHKIVTAPPHQHDVQVSYRFDDRELISHRGISVRPAAEITNYEWTLWRGRYLLSRFWLHGTAGTCDLEYDDRESHGVVLLQRAVLRKGESTFDTAFTWERVEVGKPAAVPDDGR